MAMTYKKVPLAVEATGIGKTAMRLAYDNHVIVTDEPKGRGGTDQGPPPFNTHIAALAGCTHATMNLIAQGLKIDIADVRIALAAEIDPRGAFGVERVERPVSLIQMDVSLSTTADSARIAELKDQLAWRCMVSQLLRKAGVQIEECWTVNGRAFETAAAAA